METGSLNAVLEAFGAPPDALVLFDAARLSHRHLPYLDLVSHLQGVVRNIGVDGVVEIDGRAILYVVGGSPSQVALPSLHRAVAYRADTPFLAFVEPGRLTLFDLGQRRPRTVRSIETRDAGSASFVPDLALNPDVTNRRQYSADLLLSLLESTTEKIQACGVSPDDALSLSGRAVFLRFLADRGIIGNKDLDDICPGAKDVAQCFSTRSRAQQTSTWLDRTFNGHLLPLSFATDRLEAALGNLGERKSREVLHQLSLIAHRADPSGQLAFQWGDIDFGHVPVGLLSQVYEKHAARYHPDARSHSVHFTPRQLAEYVVSEAFGGMDRPWSLRVLDPAAGAGVFLVAAFRRLVAERWRHLGRAPRTAEIREILYKQICGFDVNTAALRLAALSLYLTALEVDTDPRPLSVLRFRELLDVVLFNFQDDPVGSLDHGADPRFSGKFDIVLGNPPWTVTTRTKERRAALLDAVRAAAAGLDVNEVTGTIQIPDDNPDLSFFWVSSSWVRSDGRIALLMHARLLFKQSRQGQLARKQLFASFRVHGILNGAALRQTAVWPRVLAPFCFVLAENARPSASDEFTYASPAVDSTLNSLGMFRVDYSAAQPIGNQAAIENPHLFKTMFRGTALDLPILSKIEQRGQPLGVLWSETYQLAHGDGFQMGGRAGRQRSAAALIGLPVLRRDRKMIPPLVETKRLPKFSEEHVLRPRSVDIFRAPLVLFPAIPRARVTERWGHLALHDVAFNESFYGFSAKGHPDADLLARYLHLVLSSDIFLYYALLTSSMLSVERDEVTKEDLDEFPVVPLHSLPVTISRRIHSVSEAFCKDPVPSRAEVNRFVASCYGLRSGDEGTIVDTLAAGLPFAENKRRSQDPASDASLRHFSQALRSELQRLLACPDIQVGEPIRAGSWVWIDIAKELGRSLSSARSSLLEAVGVADRLGSSQVIIVHGDGSMRVGLVNQARYLTASRGRLCAWRLAEDYAPSLRRLIAS